MTVVAFSGGIGGAKLALGLSKLLAPEELTLIANIGDDFEHLGLSVSPDLDTLMYTLAGAAHPETGWGRSGERWNFMAAMEQLGGETWFRLGDRDLATHVERTRRLRAGETLSEVTAALCRRVGVGPRILPASDDAVRTIVQSALGPIAFQHYFVREQCEPAVTGFAFAGAQQALPAPGVIEAITDPGLQAIVFCPSNPFISIDPILAIPAIRSALAARRRPAIAVSPIVGGDALKGPTAKMMRELGLPSIATAVARHYGSLLDGFVLDEADRDLAADVEALGPRVLVTNTVMPTLDDRIALARAVLEFAARLA